MNHTVVAYGLLIVLAALAAVAVIQAYFDRKRQHVKDVIKLAKEEEE